MTYRFFILVLICCASSPIGLYAQCNQWQSISSGTTNLLRAVHFPNAQNGWAVGSGGTLLRSQDGGTTWANQSTALGAGGRELYSVHFANAATGWVVGARGFVRKTTDGGNIWLPQTVNTATDLYDVCFTDANNGWIVGACGLLLRTTDGGGVWQPISSGQSYHLNAVAAANGTNVAAASSGTVMLRSSNSGANWSAATGVTSSLNFRALAFSGATGWSASTDGSIWKSTNGGALWLFWGSAAPFTGAWQTASSTTANVYIAGLGGKLVRSGGTATFTDFSDGIATEDLYGLQMLDDNTGWAVGAGGKIFRYASAAAVPACVASIPLHQQTNIPATTAISWPAAVGCVSGYRLSLGTTPGGTELLDNQDVGNVTTYQPSTALPAGSTIYVRVVPYGAAGSASGCGEFLFWTAGCNRRSDSLELVKLYNATDGLNWTNKWDLTKPINTWYGVQVNAQGCVTCIDLDGAFGCSWNAGGGNNLNGTIPDLSLPNLFGLYLSRNALSGSIPNFTNMLSLNNFTCSNNNLSGSIPDFINTPALNRFWCGNNQLSGSIPDFKNLPNLQNFDCVSNQLSGNIPDFTNLPKLQFFLCFSNQLSGSIPDFKNLPVLQDFRCQTNKLSGSIPNFSNLPNLDWFACARNNLTDTIPDFKNLSKLRLFHCFNNNLTGKIPDFKNLPNLALLHCHNNQLSGSIPNLNLPKLGALQVHGNRIVSSALLNKLPMMGLTVSQFDSLTLYNNQLTFKDILPNMPLIIKMNGRAKYASQDSIFHDTTITRTAGQPLTIDLGIDASLTTNAYQWYKNGSPWTPPAGNSSNSNKLIFNALQASDAGAYHVRVTNPGAPALTLYGRKIVLTIQSGGACHPDKPALTAFYRATGGNNWTAQWDTTTCNVCDWFGITCNANGRVTCLDLDGDALPCAFEGKFIGNNLIGQLPKEIGELPFLTSIMLSDNKLVGPIPASIGQLSNLYSLGLYGNQITDIPTEINQLTNLGFLNIGSNKVVGTLPNLSNLTKLETLWLPNNKFTGSIHSSYGNLTALKTLGLSLNDLTGGIPPSLGNLDSLKELNLRGNKLTGCIPYELKNLCSHVTMGDISNNPGLNTQSWTNFCANNAGICVQPDMVVVPGGTFDMGCLSGCETNETPVHDVTVLDFKIGKYEVTQGEWTALFGTNPSGSTCSGSDCPVERVSWYDAAVFCNRLSEQNNLTPCYFADAALSQVYGKNGNTWSLPNSGTVYWKKDADGYRLPTEAEWEYAARGGAQSQGYSYAGGNGPNVVAWHSGNSGTRPHAVGTRTPNELGLYDMSGNVWELCWDWYAPYSSAAVCSPIGPDTGVKRLCRGGAWQTEPNTARVAYRPDFPVPTETTNTIGFRLAQGKVLPNCTNVLVQPVNAATNVPTNTTLRWASSNPCVSGYRLSLGTTPGGSQILNNATVTDTFYQAALPAGATVYVRIVPFNGAGEASGCGEFSFGTAPKTLECTTPPNTKATAFQYVYGDTDAQSVPVDGATQTCDGGYAAVGYTNDKKLYFFKTDANGQVEFSKYYENPDFDLRGSGVLYKEGDGYLLYGAGISVALLNRLFVIKTDLSGNPQWSKSYELRYSDIRFDTSWQVNDLVEIVVTTDSNYVLATNSAKKCVIKLDRQGNVLSDVAIIDFIPPDKTSKFFDYATDMAPTADGGVVLTGFSFTSGVPLIKLDKNLNIQFAKNFDDSLPFSSCEDVGGQVLQTSDGGYLITGGTKTHGNGVCTPNYGGYTDAFVLKTDAAGNYIWSKTYGAAGNGNFGIGLHPLDAENYLLSIHSNATGQGGSIVYGSIKQSDGTINWARNIDGTCSEYGGVQPLPLGGYLLNGSTSSAGNGGNDHLLIKMDTSLMATGCFSSTPVTLQAVSYTPANRTNILEVAINMTAFPINLAITVSDARFSAKSTCTCSTLVTNTSDDDCTGSLRSAIRCANRNPGPDTIRFNIPGAGPHVINLMSELPRLTDSATVLDATTQPGWKLGKIVLEWKGGANGNPSIMFIEGNKCEIYGLHFRNIYGSNDFGAQILGSNNIFGGDQKPNLFNDANIAINVGGTNNTIQYNYFGTDTTGAVLGNKQPLGINGNYIGIGTTVNSSNISIHHNIFSGYQFGIVGNGSGTIRNNYFGTDTSNTAALNLEMGLAVQNNGSYEINQNIFANCSSWAINFNSNATIGQNKVIKNIIRDNGSGIELETSNGNLFSQNSIYCNGAGIAILAGGNNNQPAPQILTPLNERLAGTATAGAAVELFLHDTTGCSGVPCQGKTYLGTATADAAGKWSLLAPFTTPLKAGDQVTATATDPQNNTSAFANCASVIVCNVMASAGSDTISCSGSSLTLTASGGTNYQWSDNGPATAQWTFAPTATKTYTVTVTDANGCTAVDSVKVTVQSGLECGLVAHYNFDGNSRDTSGRSNHGVLNGAYYWNKDRFGNCQRALHLNGFSQKGWVRVTNSNSLKFNANKQMTLSLWVELDELAGMTGAVGGPLGPNGFHMLVAKGGDGLSTPNGFYYGLFSTGNNLIVQGQSSGIGAPSNMTLSNVSVQVNYTTKSWKHIVMAVTPDSIQAYVNGVLVYKALSKTNFTDADSKDLLIGIMDNRFGPPTWYPLKGSLDDLRLYNRALSPAEINALYTLPNDNPNPPPAALAIAPKNTICTGDTVALAATPVQVGYTYTWLRDGQPISGANAAAFNATQPGSYQVRVASGPYCDSLSPAVVLVRLPDAAVSVAVGDTLDCATTTVRLTATGGDSYQWSSGLGTANMANATQAGTYTVTVTRAGNCPTTATATVLSDKAAPTATATGGLITCASPITVLQGSSPTQGVTYAWTGPNGFGSTQQNPPVNVEGTYTLTVKGKNGCADTVFAVVAADKNPPNISVKGDTITCAKPTIQLAGASTTPNVSYLWTGPNSFASNLPNPSIAAPGAYTLRVTGANGCTATSTLPIIEDKVPPTVGALGDTITCKKLAGLLKGSTTTTGATLQWSGPQGYTLNQANAPASEPGVYRLTVRAPNGCTATTTATLASDTLRPQGVIAQGGALSCQPGTLTLRATASTPGVEYHWAGPNGFSFNGPMPTVNVAGTYSLTCIPRNGCTVGITTVVNAPILPMLSALGGTLTCSSPIGFLQGTSPVPNAAYRWTGPNGFAFNGPRPPVNVAGVYTLMVTNPATGCTATTTAEVLADNVPPSAFITAPQGLEITCFQTNVTLQVLAVPGLDYAWTGPGGFTGNTPQINVGTPGAYRVTVSNPANGCSSIEAATVTNNTAPPIPTASGGILNCETAFVRLQASASIPGASYTWLGPNGFMTGQEDPPVNAPGLYTVTARDAQNGCTATATAEVREDYTPPQANIATPDGLKLTCETPTLLLQASNQPSYTHRWSGNLGTWHIVSINAPGTYSVTVTDGNNGCTTVGSVSATEDKIPPIPSILAPKGVVLTCYHPTLTLEGKGGDTYWNGPAGFSSANNQVEVGLAGTYTLIATNSGNGCTATTTLSLVEDKAPPVGVFALGDTLTCLKDTALLQGGSNSPNATYTWSGPGLSGISGTQITVSTPGAYLCTATNLNGCTTAIGTTVVDRRDAPQITAAGCTLGCLDHSCQLKGGSSVARVDFEWRGPNNFFSLASGPIVKDTGTYYLTITNPSNDCRNNTSVKVEAPPRLPVAIAGADKLCPGDSANLSATAGFTKYTWSNGQTTANISVNAAQTYTVTVSDAAGCTGTAIHAIVLSVAPVPKIAGDTILCPGEQTKLSVATGFTRYEWSTGESNTSINVGTAGTYSITVWNAAGCKGTDVATILPGGGPPLQITGAAYLCPGRNTGLTANTGFTRYQWSSGDTTAGIVANKAQAYGITVTDVAGCTQSASITVKPAQHILKEMSQTICEGDSISFCGQYWHVSGEYPCVLNSYQGCDSVVTLQLEVLQKDRISAGDDRFLMPTGATEMELAIGENDTLPSDPNWQLEIVRDAASGQLNIKNNSIVYKRDSDFNGVDSFAYQVCPTTCPNLCDTAWVWVIVPSNLSRYITNVLSPEVADGENDLFDPVAGYKDQGYAVTSAHLRIYTAWGHLIWQMEREAPVWDGKINGKSVPQGTYYYEVSADVGAKEPLVVWGVLTVLW